MFLLFYADIRNPTLRVGYTGWYVGEDFGVIFRLKMRNGLEWAQRGKSCTAGSGGRCLGCGGLNRKFRFDGMFGYLLYIYIDVTFCCC